jgi:hypothetical protein
MVLAIIMSSDEMSTLHQLHSIRLLHKQLLVYLREEHDMLGVLLDIIVSIGHVLSVFHDFTQLWLTGNNTDHAHDYADHIELLLLLKGQSPLTQEEYYQVISCMGVSKVIQSVPLMGLGGTSLSAGMQPCLSFVTMVLALVWVCNIAITLFQVSQISSTLQ